MKRTMLCAAIAAFVLSGCGQAYGDEPGMGNIIGELGRYGSVYEFTTPSGAYCIYVSGYKQGGLSCKFPE